MAKKQSGKGKRRVPKAVLRLPDLDQAKSAVLNGLSSIDAQRGYRHAIEEFIEWYCSEPRLSFSKAERILSNLLKPWPSVSYARSPNKDQQPT